MAKEAGLRREIHRPNSPLAQPLRHGTVSNPMSRLELAAPYPDGTCRNHLGCGAPLDYSGCFSKEGDHLIDASRSRATRRSAPRPT